MYKLTFTNLSLPNSREYTYFVESIGMFTIFKIGWLIYKFYGSSEVIHQDGSTLVYENTSKYGHTLRLSIEEADTDSDSALPNPV